MRQWRRATRREAVCKSSREKIYLICRLGRAFPNDPGAAPKTAAALQPTLPAKPPPPSPIELVETHENRWGRGVLAEKRPEVGSPAS